MINAIQETYAIPEVTVGMYLHEVSAIMDRKPINTTEDMGNLLRQQFATADREYFIAINLDNLLRPISYHVLNSGWVNGVNFSIPNLFKTAIIQNAASIVICHNHPGGELQPSAEDLEATRKCVAIGKMIGINVIDHIILGYGAYNSLRDCYPELFEEKGGAI